ncbi:MAG: MBOAT family protein [Clostridiales bacterium]|nr:MBOAT family protein [Clostridiales bacterium]
MLFASYNFIVFISVLFIIYYIIPKKYQWVLLLLASYLFYFFAGPSYLIYIAATTISTYIAGRMIGNIAQSQARYLSEHKKELTRGEKRVYRDRQKSKMWRWLLACLLFNFGILAVVKYSNFVIANINHISKAVGGTGGFSFWNIALPMGISFYTFQTMGYIIDVYRGKYSPEKNIFKLALFVSFFPQLVQGPISRFDDLSQTLFKEHPFEYRNISFGLQRIVWGYFKKVVIADRIMVAVNTLIKDPETYQGAFALVGMLFYAFQLYADFTGGIDITIGIAEVLGIKVKENFDRPYFSKSIAEYWRRWHITMGTWFRDYLFYPLSTSKGMMKIYKFTRQHFNPYLGKRIPVYISTIIVWFTTGLWHGSSWNFIVWGLMNCFVIVISQELEPLYSWFHSKVRIGNTIGFRVFQVIRTVLLLSAIRMFDCYRDVPTTFRMFGSMFTVFNYRELFNGSMLNLGLSMADYGVLLLGLVILLTVSLVQRKGSVRAQLASRPHLIRYAIYYALLIAILIFGAYGVGYDSSQFIYNQF